MTIIRLETRIRAARKICFDLSRSIDLHLASTKETGEQAISGKTRGLISMGESVTWRAKHFGIWQILEVKIIALEEEMFFRDEMVKGVFISMSHLHEFEQEGEYTVMRDTFEYKCPLGTIGRLFDVLVLEKYMRKFLVKRNACIKAYAESDDWQRFVVHDVNALA